LLAKAPEPRAKRKDFKIIRTEIVNNKEYEFISKNSWMI
jgi:hypothetical protein